MATTPRVSKDLLDSFAIQMDAESDHPLAQIVAPIELSILSGIPVRNKKSFQLDPVLHELIRLYNAKANTNCQHCQNLRHAVAVQAGMNEDMVGALINFETSDLPDQIKAALRIVAAMVSNPGLLTDEILTQARQYYTDLELIDIILLTMHTATTKTVTTLGLDPGKESSNRVFFPTESELFGDSEPLVEAIEELRRQGFAVEAPGGDPVPIGAALRPEKVSQS